MEDGSKVWEGQEYILKGEMSVFLMCCQQAQRFGGKKDGRAVDAVDAVEAVEAVDFRQGEDKVHLFGT